MSAARILNFGSRIIDHSCRVPRLARPAETRHASSYCRSAGGKGLNQSLALARAGARVAQAGKVGADGTFLVQAFSEAPNAVPAFGGRTPCCPPAASVPAASRPLALKPVWF